MSQSVKPLVKNCFAPIPEEQLGPQLPDIEFETEREEWVLIPEAKEVDGDPEHIVVEYKPIKKNVYNLQEYIESFADDVGIQNIIRKISISGDKSLLNQTGRDPLCPDGGLEPVQDYTGVPKNKTEAFNAVVNGVNAFDSLPEDLTNKMSMEQFVKLFGQDQFDAYIKNLVNNATAKEEVKE